jgi:hypothetical protein
MGEPVSDSKMPAFVAFGLVALGLVIAVIGSGGLFTGSVGGGIVAACGAIPACFGMWKGIQQETQGTLAISVLAVLASLGVGAVLIILRIVHWVS